MAARTNKRLHDEQTKRRIQASQLLNRLISYAKGKVEMTQGQVLAAKVVIGKSIPDLKSIEYSGNDEKPAQRHMIVEFVNPRNSAGDSQVPWTETATLQRQLKHICTVIFDSFIFQGHHLKSCGPR